MISCQFVRGIDACKRKKTWTPAGGCVDMWLIRRVFFQCLKISLFFQRSKKPIAVIKTLFKSVSVVYRSMLSIAINDQFVRKTHHVKSNTLFES